jgi:GT2 family glycosyltransferase
MAVTDVGVVVIGRNEGERLIQCLTSLAPYAERGGRIVYVDSGSIDGSMRTAERLGAMPFPLSPERPFNAARARNAGAKRLAEAAPDVAFIQFVDGDCTLAADWIEKARGFLAGEPKVAVVCGRRRERFPGHSLYNRFMDLEWSAPIGKVAACGGDAMIRREAFDAVGGFNSAIVAGEEPELCFRLRDNGWTIWRLDAEMTLHDAALRRFSQWWKRSVRSGYGCAQLFDVQRGRMASDFTRQLLRSIAWTLLGPFALLAAALVSKWFLVLLLAYPAQLVRIALRARSRVCEPWTYAAVMVADHFAGFVGACQYAWQAMTGHVPRQADYK